MISLCHKSIARVARNTRFLIAGLLMGAALVLGAEANQVELQIRPSICVSYNSDAPCSMAMEISWQASVPIDVCLHENQNNEPLACWQQARSGTMELQYADTQDVLYQLLEQNSATVLASADIKVINRDLRSSRKRRRHVWSIL